MSNASGGAGSGVAVVGFTVVSSGAIVGAHVARSSGSSEVDQAALSAVRRTGSVPPPPTGGSKSFSVPIRFN